MSLRKRLGGGQELTQRLKLMLLFLMMLLKGLRDLLVLLRRRLGVWEYRRGLGSLRGSMGRRIGGLL